MDNRIWVVTSPQYLLCSAACVGQLDSKPRIWKLLRALSLGSGWGHQGARSPSLKKIQISLAVVLLPFVISTCPHALIWPLDLVPLKTQKTKILNLPLPDTPWLRSGWFWAAVTAAVALSWGGVFKELLAFPGFRTPRCGAQEGFLKDQPLLDRRQIPRRRLARAGGWERFARDEGAKELRRLSAAELAWGWEEQSWRADKRSKGQNIRISLARAKMLLPFMDESEELGSDAIGDKKSM